MLFCVCLYEESKALAPCGVRDAGAVCSSGGAGLGMFFLPCSSNGQTPGLWSPLKNKVWGCHPGAAACAGQRGRGLAGGWRPPTLISHPWGDAGETWGGGVKVVLCKALHCTEGRKLNLS